MPQYPKPLIDPQEIIRRNNENAAVHRVYRAKRRLRRKLQSKLAPRGLKLPEKILDAFDWQEAGRETRSIRAVGCFLPKKS